MISPVAIPALLAATYFAQPNLPTGYVVPPSSVSPNQRYGISVFDNTLNPIPGSIESNKVIELSTGRIVGAINALSAMMHMNRGGILPARWSRDESLLLWEVEGRWSPWALTLLQIQNGEIKWQFDVLRTVQQAILDRTRAAAPEKYVAAKERNQGNGSAFPDGFTVNVRAEGDKERGSPKEDVKGKPISLPLKVHAELTSNPKLIEHWPKEAQLDSELDGIISETGKFSVTQFRLREKPFPNATSSSWLELTHPSAAAQAPPEYGDVVSLRGTLTTNSDELGESIIYILVLEKPISVLSVDNEPDEGDVREIRLIDLERWGSPPVGCSIDVSGTIGHAERGNRTAHVTLRVREYGYGSRPCDWSD